MPKETVFITSLEVDIIRIFWEHLYLTDKEIAKELRLLAEKLDNKSNG